MASVYIFGEDHNNLIEIKRINDRIRSIEPDYLLHELLYGDLVLSKDAIKQRLNDCEEGHYCDPRLNKDIYELGYEMALPLIGIDPPIPDVDRMPLSRRFEIREKHMVNMIERYRLKGDIVVVVGDAHLRTEATRQLGRPSLIQTVFAGRAIIERSQTARYEEESSIPSFLNW